MENLAAQVRELIVASDSYRRTMAAAVDLSVVEAAVLGHLLHDGPQTPTVIAARAGLTASAGTALLDRLETARFVGRAPHPDDRRRVLVGLTERGSAAVTAQFGMFSADLLETLSGADPRLRGDPTLRLALTEVLAAMAAALRTRAADTAGVREAVQNAMATRTSGEAGDGPCARTD